MEAGALRHRIVIQTPTETRDAFGGIATTWGTYATRWADIEPQAAGGREESFAADQNIGKALYKFTLRYLSGVTAKMRVSWNSRTFDIRSVQAVKLAEQQTVIVAEETI